MGTVSVSHAPGPPPAMVVLMVLFGLMVFLGVLAFAIFLYCRIVSKTGHPWALGFLILVPFGNLILLCVLAFSDWPVLRTLRQLQDHPT